MVICSDYNNRGAKNIPVKKVVDDALAMDCDSIETVWCIAILAEKYKWKQGEISGGMMR